MLNNFLNKNIPNTIWRTRYDNKNLISCATCRGEGFSAKVTETTEGYAYHIKGKDSVYRNKVNNLDELISDVTTIFNTLDND